MVLEVIFLQIGNVLWTDIVSLYNHKHDGVTP